MLGFLLPHNFREGIWRSLKHACFDRIIQKYKVQVFTKKYYKIVALTGHQSSILNSIEFDAIDNINVRVVQFCASQIKFVQKSNTFRPC